MARLINEKDLRELLCEAYYYAERTGDYGMEEFEIDE